MLSILFLKSLIKYLVFHQEHFYYQFLVAISGDDSWIEKFIMKLRKMKLLRRRSWCNMLEIDLLNFYKGRKLLYKRITGLHKEHILDPTVIQKVKNSGLILDPTIKQDTQHIDLFALRQQMGSPNKDLTTTLIRIQSLLVPLSDRQIPVTFFKPKTFDRMTIFLHGGGYIGGSSRVLSHQCKYLAECSHALVVSIDYRLAPENPFPAAYNDCYEVVKWLIHNLESWHIDQKKVAISGESAGGAFALAISASDLGRSIALTVPIYGALDIQPCEQLSY